MKDGVVLVNCARGDLYNEDALYDGLKSGKIRFAGIDVFGKEPAINNKLLDLVMPLQLQKVSLTRMHSIFQ